MPLCGLKCPASIWLTGPDEAWLEFHYTFRPKGIVSLTPSLKGLEWP